MTTRDTVFQVVAEETGHPLDHISEGTEIAALGVDSLEFLNLMLSIEKAVRAIPQERYGYIHTVGDIIRELA